MRKRKETKLREWMREADMGVTELSDRTGIRVNTLYRRLRGESDFRVEDILKISEALSFGEEEITKIFFSK